MSLETDITNAIEEILDYNISDADDAVRGAVGVVQEKITWIEYKLSNLISTLQQAGDNSPPK